MSGLIISLEPKAPAPPHQDPPAGAAASDSSSLSLQPAQSHECAADAAKRKQEKERVRQEIRSCERSYDTILGKIMRAQQGHAAILREYEKQLHAIREHVPLIDDMLDLQKSDLLHYTGEKSAEVNNLFLLRHLMRKADEQIQSLEKDLVHINNEMRNKYKELGCYDPFCNSSAVEEFRGAFLALDDNEKEKMSRLLWLSFKDYSPATLQPDKAILVATPKEIDTMSRLYQIVKRFERFQAAIHAKKAPEKIKRVWDRMATGHAQDRADGIYAQKILLTRVWKLRGMMSADRKNITDSELTYENTLQPLDWPVLEALRRLSDNPMRMIQQGDWDLLKQLHSWLETRSQYRRLDLHTIKDVLERYPYDILKLITSMLSMHVANHPDKQLHTLFAFFEKNSDTDYIPIILQMIKAAIHSFPEQRNLPSVFTRSASPDEKKLG